MKLIKQSFAIHPQENGLEGIYKQIEWAGRHCYKSLDKITEDSAKGFVERMIKSKHYAMLEHGTVYLERDVDYSDADYNTFETLYEKNPYSKVTFDGGLCYVTTNFRVIVENGWMYDLQYLCEPTEYHEKRVTVKFVTDQGILREFTRHRVFSFAVESTR